MAQRTRRGGAAPATRRTSSLPPVDAPPPPAQVERAPRSKDIPPECEHDWQERGRVQTGAGEFALELCMKCAATRDGMQYQ